MVNAILFQMMDFIIDKKVPLPIFMKILFYQLPAYAVLAFPMATLFATLIAISRMSKDSEVDVMRTSGISVTRMMLPMLFMGLLVSASSFVMLQKLVPWANNHSITLWRSYLMSDPSAAPTANIFFKGKGNRQFYIGNVDPKSKIATSITIYEVTDSQYPVMTTARTGIWDDKYLILKNGTMHHFNKDGLLNYEAAFGEMKLNIEREMEEVFGEQKTAQEMTIEELKKKITTFKKSGIDTKSWETDLQFKMSIPIASFICVLVGVPLSIRSGRSSMMMGIAVSVALILMYWVGTIVFTTLGRKGVIPPVYAAWSQNALFLLVGIALTLRTRK